MWDSKTIVYKNIRIVLEEESEFTAIYLLSSIYLEHTVQETDKKKEKRKTASRIFSVYCLVCVSGLSKTNYALWNGGHENQVLSKPSAHASLQ